jgi:hypothetical protein
MEAREHLIAAVSNWETPVSRFQMRDERIRFEVTTEPLKPMSAEQLFQVKM